jgi:hypothetical protein
MGDGGDDDTSLAIVVLMTGPNGTTITPNYKINLNHINGLNYT